jgi:hypothetical protein
MFFVFALVETDDRAVVEWALLGRTAAYSGPTNWPWQRRRDEYAVPLSGAVVFD